MFVCLFALEASYFGTICDATYVLCDIELDDSDWGMGSGSNNLAFDLAVGDNFAMRAKGRNAKGADFYILNV
jgi:hypothetical protein